MADETIPRLTLADLEEAVESIRRLGPRPRLVVGGPVPSDQMWSYRTATIDITLIGADAARRLLHELHERVASQGPGILGQLGILEFEPFETAVRDPVIRDAVLLLAARNGWTINAHDAASMVQLRMDAAWPPLTDWSSHE